MTTQRWKLGTYTVAYNPKEDSRNLRSTAQTEMMVNGQITNQNRFYDNNIDFTLDIYDKPTYFNSSSLTSSNQYISVTENNSTGDLFVLLSGGNSIEKISKSNGSVLSTITPSGSASGSAICLSYLNAQISVFYSNLQSGCTLSVYGESGNQISKYTYTDVDMAGSVSTAWDGNNTVYLLCKYGKVFSINLSGGASTLVSQFSDYDSTHSSNSYKAIYYYNGYFGILVNSTLAFYDSSFNRIFATDIQYNSQINAISSISYGSNSGDSYMLSNHEIVKMFPNTCGVDIQKIKSIVANGATTLVDEKGTNMNVIIKSMPIKRLRNRQDTRYEINFSGVIM